VFLYEVNGIDEDVEAAVGQTEGAALVKDPSGDLIGHIEILLLFRHFHTGESEQRWFVLSIPQFQIEAVGVLSLTLGSFSKEDRRALARFHV
jgi:hypothetical protein